MGKRKFALVPGCVISATNGSKVKYFLYLGTRDNICYPTMKVNNKYQIFLPLNFQKFDESVTEDKIVDKVNNFIDKGRKGVVGILPNGYSTDKVIMEPTARLQHEVAIIRDFVDETI